MATGKVERGAPETFTLSSANSKVTITDANCFKFGRIVIGSARLSVSDTISSNQPILSGAPIGNTTMANGSSFGSSTSSNKDESFSIMNYNSSCYIYSGSSISSGNKMISFVYVSAN